MKKLLLVVLAASLAVLIGCGKANEKISEKMIEKAIEKNGGGKAKVDVDQGKVSIKTKDGETTYASGGAAEIPADFPKDVLVYKNAAVQLAITNPDAFVLNLLSKDGADKIAGDYSAEMKARGWQQEGMMNVSGQIVLTFSKEKRNASVSIVKADQGVQITLSVVKPKE
jgi:hypothetical protein